MVLFFKTSLAMSPAQAFSLRLTCKALFRGKALFFRRKVSHACHVEQRLSMQISVRGVMPNRRVCFAHPGKEMRGEEHVSLCLFCCTTVGFDLREDFCAVVLSRCGYSTVRPNKHSWLPHLLLLVLEDRWFGPDGRRRRLLHSSSALTNHASVATAMLLIRTSSIHRHHRLYTRAWHFF
jgi:hypothetical protein